MYCWKCGTKNEEQAVACTSCQSNLAMPMSDSSKGKIFSSSSHFTIETNGTKKVYKSWDEIPPEEREMLQSVFKNVGFGGGFGFKSSLFKVLTKNVIKGGDETLVIDGESGETQPGTFERPAKKTFSRPSFEVKPVFRWELIIGAIIIGALLFAYFTFYNS